MKNINVKDRLDKGKQVGLLERQMNPQLLSSLEEKKVGDYFYSLTYINDEIKERSRCDVSKKQYYFIDTWHTFTSIRL
ncbi:hypothetical protein [Pseudobacteroides cellulosolvens]|uniref:hypothetical protein n=1 Tax=Pseudobacteroides cellulosolvens TaxID=35825 RepID=UPI00055FDB78|nr:hypothetical protein [Pseudobacteroides cellulosolvens]